VTQLEKNIYNSWLATTRSSTGKPFRLRKNFDDFESDKNYFFVQKLSRFFTKYKDIDLRDFFVAPYKVYSDNILYDLKFYISQKAIKVYKIYKNKLDN